MRLIDADALLEKIKQREFGFMQSELNPPMIVCRVFERTKGDVCELIENATTVDAVPVTLIENCIYTWGKQARRLGSGRESTCFGMMAEAAKTILQIHADSQKIKMTTDGVKTVQFKKWKMFELSDLTNQKPITEEDCMTYYDTDRDLLIEDMQGLETILLALQGVGPELTDKAVITALARAMYHVLAYAVRIIDRQKRREKSEHGRDDV